MRAYIINQASAQRARKSKGARGSANQKMQIKPINNGELTPIDVHEWNEEVKAFLRPLGGFEQLVFNDYFLEFYNKDVDNDARYNAGFNAALMTLVDADGNALLSEDDRAIVKRASFTPIFRVFTHGLKTEGGELETAKKN